MYALAFLGLRRSAGGFCVAGAALGALPRVGCTPWRPLVSGGFCVAGAALGALQGVGCTPWRLGLRCSAGGFCVAGVALRDTGVPFAMFACVFGHILLVAHSVWLYCVWCHCFGSKWEAMDM